MTDYFKDIFTICIKVFVGISYCLKGKYNGSQISRNIKSIEYASIYLGLPCGSVGKEFTCNGETWVRSLSWEDPLEKGIATYSRILAWRIPWTEEPGRPQSMELKESDTTEQLFTSLHFSSILSPLISTLCMGKINVLKIQTQDEPRLDSMIIKAT